MKKVTKIEYSKKMEKNRRDFDKLWQKIVIDTNDFVKDNPDISVYSLVDIGHFIDDLSLSGAWICDRINGYNYDSKKGLTKKMRKILGFLIP